jgi:hypothetical protein
VAREVIDQACANHPEICVEDNGVTHDTRKKASLKSAILSWMNKLRPLKERNELVFVGQDKFNERLAICARCPKNTAIPESCSSCKAALNALREGLIGNRKYDGRLNACVTLAEYLPVSAWLDEVTTENGDLPDECWRKRTL